jgi:hypothetical protein
LSKNPAIVVLAYNRPESLKRLLSSLEKANYSSSVQLIISLDHADNNPEVLHVATSFDWKYGIKEIIKHDKQLGLYEHVMRCGAFSYDHEAIIMLEDDLYVSPYFYDVSLQLLGFSSQKNDISQISLYSPYLNEFADNDRFITVEDGKDLYLMKSASSWGQLWTADMWEGFDKWLQTADIKKLKAWNDVPPKILKWPSSSWKKIYNAYLVDQDKYVLYSKKSYTTNLGNSGTNHRSETYVYNVTLAEDILHIDHEISSIRKYDQYMELMPTDQERREIGLAGEVLYYDVFGIRPLKTYLDAYLITFRETSSALKSYSRELMPYHLNVISNIEGNQLYLTKGRDCNPKSRWNQSILSILKSYRVKYLVKGLWEKVFFKLRSKLSK